MTSSVASGSGGLCAGVGGSGGVGGPSVFVIVGGVAYGGGIAAVGECDLALAGSVTVNARDGLRGIQQASWAAPDGGVLRRAG